MTKVIVLAAGEGQRFVASGNTTPKAFIDINGLPMAVRSAKSLSNINDFIFIFKDNHVQAMKSISNSSIESKIDLSGISKYEVVYQEGSVYGPAETALQADKLINDDDDVFIMYCDQEVDFDVDKALALFKQHDGGFITFVNNTLSYPHVSISASGNVKSAIEIGKPNNPAIAGIYYIKKWSDFKKYYDKTVELRLSIGGQYYISTLFNQAIKDGKSFVTYESDKFISFGTPEELDSYLNMPL